MVADKPAFFSEEDKRKIKSRMNRIAGQTRGISKMISEDSYCDEIFNQIKSVESAMRGVQKALLEAHMRAYVIGRIKNGDNKIIDELLRSVSET